MPKEWVLNIATNRWGLNKKNSVGPVATWIRECDPRSLEDWENCYFIKLKDFLEDKGISLKPSEYLAALGERLFVKISEVLQKEVEEITEKDCKDYIKSLVIERAFEGFLREKQTVYQILERELGVPIEPAPDEIDRRYNVDFLIRLKNRTLGLQIKPITYQQTPEIHKWLEWQRKTHQKFEEKFGGKVFVIFSLRKGKKEKEILNPMVIEEIKKEFAL